MEHDHIVVIIHFPGLIGALICLCVPQSQISFLHLDIIVDVPGVLLVVSEVISIDISQLIELGRVHVPVSAVL